MKLFGGIEAGGTKFICGISDGENLVQRVRIPTTTTPKKTMAKVLDYFKKIHQKTPLSALGICSFGPLDTNPVSPYYGFITTTPKQGWEYFNIVGSIKEVFDLPIGFDTDVDGAVIGEYRWGNGRGCDAVVYWTVGTGIGAGGMLGGRLMRGLIHPETGHIFTPHDKEKDPFEGVCPYHGNCLEGLASGPALQKRCGVKSIMDLPPDDPVWDLEVEYLGYAMVNCIMTMLPQRIILGGGVMQREELLPRIREKTLQNLNGYIRHKNIVNNIDQYIVPAYLRGNQGLFGAFALAENAERERNW